MPSQASYSGSFGVADELIDVLWRVNNATGALSPEEDEENQSDDRASVDAPNDEGQTDSGEGG